jgi:hypothetical protein
MVFAFRSRQHRRVFAQHRGEGVSAVQQPLQQWNYVIFVEHIYFFFYATNCCVYVLGSTGSTMRLSV